MHDKGPDIDEFSELIMNVRRDVRKSDFECFPISTLDKMSADMVPLFSAVYYSSGGAATKLLNRCLEHLSSAVLESGGELITVTVEPCAHGTNLQLEPDPSGHADIYQRILAGCAAALSTVVFTVEHDVIYPPSHFSEGVSVVQALPGYYGYNTNYVHLDSTGWYDGESVRILSQLFARKALIEAAFSAKLSALRHALENNLEHHFVNEPGDSFSARGHQLSVPCVDIRHNSNFTNFGRTRLDPPHYDNHPTWGHHSEWQDIWI